MERFAVIFLLQIKKQFWLIFLRQFTEFRSIQFWRHNILSTMGSLAPDTETTSIVQKGEDWEALQKVVHSKI